MSGEMKAKYLILLAFLLLGPAQGQGAEPAQLYKQVLRTNDYICPPCYHTDEDQEVYKQDGQCPICGMALIENPRHAWKSEIDLHTGSGNFTLAGGSARAGKSVTVFYQAPSEFSPQSRILLVIPGGGRNAWDYRDSWIEASERHDLLILSLAYAEAEYSFADYHMGGVIENLQFNNLRTSGPAKSPNKYHLRDEDIVFDLNQDPGTWLFNDFDHVFERVVAATGSAQKDYDIFGHSAGGQILHRLAVFKPGTRARTIVAANSGQYTIPVTSLDPPFGLKGLDSKLLDMPAAFATRLVLMVGELDNKDETRGTMLHTPIADQQGLGRLERGQYFFRQSKDIAEAMNLPFNWQIQTIRDTGHDHRKMAQAAAEFLFNSPIQ
ncbi:MAG: heavy metal-binding domain-containing protein [Pseudomonadota bacterium]